MIIEQPDINEIKTQAMALLANSESRKVSTNEEYIEASEHLKNIKIAQKYVTDIFLDPKEKAFAAHRSICAAEKKALEPLNMAEKICSEKVRYYLSEVRRREQEDAARRQKEADEKAAIESARLKKEHDDERLRIAEMLDTQGFKEEAASILEQDIPAPIVMPTIIPIAREDIKIKGQHLRDNWKAEVFDLAALVTEVSAGRQPLTMLLPNEKVLNQMAKALKGEMRIAGVRSVNDSTLVVKS